MNAVNCCGVLPPGIAPCASNFSLMAGVFSDLGLRQRAMPFIDMLKRNQQAGAEVVWGV